MHDALPCSFMKMRTQMELGTTGRGLGNSAEITHRESSESNNNWKSVSGFLCGQSSTRGSEGKYTRLHVVRPAMVYGAAIWAVDTAHALHNVGCGEKESIEMNVCGHI